MENLIWKYRDKTQFNLNCSETMLHAANEYYNLNLSKDALLMMSGFGGGIFEKHLCGIISGAIAVLGIKFKNKTLDNQNLLELTVNKFKAEFRENYEDLNCSFLLENYKNEENGCNDMIFKAATILKEIIDKYST